MSMAATHWRDSIHWCYFTYLSVNALIRIKIDQLYTVGHNNVLLRKAPDAPSFPFDKLTLKAYQSAEPLFREAIMTLALFAKILGGACVALVIGYFINKQNQKLG